MEEKKEGCGDSRQFNTSDNYVLGRGKQKRWSQQHCLTGDVESYEKIGNVQIEGVTSGSLNDYSVLKICSS